MGLRFRSTVSQTSCAPAYADVGPLWCDPHALAVTGGVVARGRENKLIVVVAGRGTRKEHWRTVDVAGSRFAGVEVVVVADPRTLVTDVFARQPDVVAHHVADSVR